MAALNIDIRPAVPDFPRSLRAQVKWGLEENSMSIVYEWLIPALWIAFGAYWWIAARGTKKTERIESIASQIAHFLPLGIAIYLVIWRHLPIDLFDSTYLAPTLAMPFLVFGAALTSAGLAF